MGDFKPLLPFASTTVIEQVLSTIREAGVDTIRVVVGWKAERLIPVLDRCGVPWVVNEGFADGMYSSVQTGVRSLPAETAAFFLLPGDMPRVQSATLARLIAEWDRRPSGILYPRYEGRRGHPPLIASSVHPRRSSARDRAAVCGSCSPATSGTRGRSSPPTPESSWTWTLPTSTGRASAEIHRPSAASPPDAIARSFRQSRRQITLRTACRPSSLTALRARCKAGRTCSGRSTRSPYPPWASTIFS